MLPKSILIALLLSAFVQAKTLTIAVAANVSYAIEELQKAFSKSHPDTKIRVILGSSGKLTAQIKNGAPYDVFMAANMKYPQSLYADGIATTKPVIYAQGALAMLSHQPQDFSKGIALIQSKQIEKIAIANPQTAPYGKATIEAIKNAHIVEGIEKKFVYAESISQTVSYAITAADVGFIAKSSLYSPKMSAYKKDIHWVEVDPKLYTPINQGIVILKHAKQNAEVKAFYDFILGTKAKTIMKKFGYILP